MNDYKRPDPSVITNLLSRLDASGSPEAGRPPADGVVFRKRPHVSILINNAHYILFKELERLMDKAERGLELTPQETIKFSKYVESLARLAREEREQDRDEDPRKMSDEALVKAARLALKSTGDDDDKEE